MGFPSSSAFKDSPTSPVGLRVGISSVPRALSSVSVDVPSSYASNAMKTPVLWGCRIFSGPTAAPTCARAEAFAVMDIVAFHLCGLSGGVRASIG